MKKITLFLSFSISFFCFSQNLPINFESDVTTTDFVNFDGGTGTVTANPMPSGTNTSASVGKIVRDGGAAYAGSKILLTNNLDFSVLTKISMKVFTSAPIGTIVKFKLEGNGPAVDVNATTTVSGQWETLEWIFIGTPNNLNEIVFMFDFGNVGDGSINSTFYFDDVAQVMGPTAPIPTSLPITFETGVVSTDLLSFSGATASVITNPQINGINSSNTVCQIIRDGGEYWSGSKIFLENPINLSTLWQITMKIYTNAPIGTRVKLELENVSGKTNVDYLTTVSGEWETASWNFYGQANDYDRISFLFDFGKVGDGTSTSTFLFDDVQQITGPSIPDPIPTSFPVTFENSVVTTDFTNFNGAITNVVANPHVTAENPSATVGQFIRSGGAPWAQSKLILSEFMDYSSLSSISMKVYTDAPIGTLLKFKVESTEEAFANERNVNTTVSGAWQTYTWDFAGDPPVYNVLTFMLGYATPNDASANATFLFDDINQVASTLSNGDDILLVNSSVNIYPNPAKNVITISAKNTTIQSIRLFNMLGNQVSVIYPNKTETTVNVSKFAAGVYFAKISTPKGDASSKLIIK